MPSKPPRLRGNAKARNSRYPLGEFPDDIVIGIGRLIVYRLAVGHADITGDDFAGIFADAISGSQFTVIKSVPGSACKFRITRPPGLIEPKYILRRIGFKENWIKRVY